MLDDCLTGRQSRGLGVGAVAEEGEHALATELGEALQVHDLAAKRGLVELPVAGDDASTERGVQRDAHRVGHGVVHSDEFEVERADLDDLTGFHANHVDHALEVVLLELGLEHGAGQVPAVDGDIDFFEEEGQRTDVVFVAVREHDTVEAVEVLHHPGPIGQDDVDAVFVLGESQSAIDHEHRAIALDDGAVHADFVETAERDESNVVFVSGRIRYLCLIVVCHDVLLLCFEKSMKK